MALSRHRGIFHLPVGLSPSEADARGRQPNRAGGVQVSWRSMEQFAEGTVFDVQRFLTATDRQRPFSANGACGGPSCKDGSAWMGAARVVDAYLRRLGVENAVVRGAVQADVINRLAHHHGEEPATRLEAQAAREVIDLVDRRLAGIVGAGETVDPRTLARARAAYLLAGGPRRDPGVLLGSNGNETFASWSRRYVLPQATPGERRRRMPLQRLVVWGPKRLKAAFRAQRGRRALLPALGTKGAR